MQLEVELNRLSELRSKLGLPYEIKAPLPEMPAPRGLSTIVNRLKEGIKAYSLENLERYGKFLTYCSVPAVVHVWSFDRKNLEQVCTRSFRDKRYHVVWCSVIDHIHRTGKFSGKLMYARRTDASTFYAEETVDGKPVSVYTYFPICRSCLATLGQIRFWTLPWVRKQIATNFNLEKFFHRADREMLLYEREIITLPE